MYIHTYVGEAITLRHVRNGVELPPIDQNLFYDFDYQITNHITPREVLRVSNKKLALYSKQLYMYNYTHVVATDTRLLTRCIVIFMYVCKRKFFKFKNLDILPYKNQESY